MSGIVGFINSSTGCHPCTLLKSMSKSIRYTESDHIDQWSDNFFSISRVHHAATDPHPQPIFNEDKSMLIVLYGEVFDYERQKQRLVQNGHVFKFTDNDAEYCLHLYEEMGKDAFKQLNGCFCITIYNLANHELLLVNDRFSSHLMFHILTDNKTLLFSTQLASILQSTEVPRELDITSVYEFITFGRILGTKTFYEDVKLLAPATILHYRDGNVTQAQYWEMTFEEEMKPESFFVDELAAAIKLSAERRTQGDLRFGLLLSGGLDSRMVLAASDKKMVCFTFGDFENREVKLARKIAETRGCKHTFLQRDGDYYSNLVDKAAQIGDGMYSFVHAHGLGFVEQIRAECDVLFHGFAIEGYFRGTNLPQRNINFLGASCNIGLEELSEESLPMTVRTMWKYSMYRLNPKQLFVEPYASNLGDVLLSSVESILGETEGHCTNVYDKFIWFDNYYKARNPAFLFEISLRTFVNERNIAFDNDVLDLHLRMPLLFRSNNRIWIRALAKLDSRLAAIPDANSGYSPYLPDYLKWGLTVGGRLAARLHLFASRQPPDPTYTQGSWPNHAELIRHNEKMKNVIYDVLLDPECLDPRIFDIQRINKIFQEQLNGDDMITVLIYRLLTFGKWHKQFGPAR